MTHWANHYIGKPWEAGRRGPDAYDCYGLVAAVQARHFGRQLPLVDGIEPTNHRQVAAAMARAGYRAGWTPIPATERAEGDIVLMAHARHPSHIGVWLEVDGGGVLHCVGSLKVGFPTLGVVFSTLPALRLARWGHLEWWRHE
ncbi:NlpC/P60 family protein [Methylocaldum gracile subsp. desertum]|uniref:NlpC/P60 family protein n=1 Tax=Methylocaldum sp. GT1BW TaxID=3438964 RepID=UPI003D9FE14C